MKIRTLLAKGGTSAVFLVTDDCQQAYKELASRGVEFQETPEERPYGIDAGFRDPSGNNFRLTQLKELG
jgi:predicted enzyme related to lactoylglutathione lyase